MAGLNFRVTVDLSSFFSDYRQRVRLFINEDIKTIKDVNCKLEEYFNINNFILMSGKDCLPPSEDIRLLLPDEIIR